MDARLHPHAVNGKTIVESIDVAIEWVAADRLWLRYHAELPQAAPALPDPAEPTRADGLWHTTCFELFLRRAGDDAYCEFNFSPSSRWAAYRFTSLRTGMTPLDLSSAPEIDLEASESHFALEAMLTLPLSFEEQPLLAAIAAVIEAADGSKSYWALAHRAEKPDFHLPDCFMLELAPPSAA